MKVLILLGHPRTDSFCGALAESYATGARESGAIVKTVAISALDFDANVTVPEPEDQFFESDLISVREAILWADHIVFVFPTWWGSMPGMLKSFIDRIFTPGFAFNEKRKWSYEKLLSGRTAQLIITMDTPVLVYKFIYKAPGQHLLADATLKFCGISPVRVKLISPVKYSSLKDRERWLREAKQSGADLKKGVLTPREKMMRKVTPWLKALRLQFYPMTFIAYATGAFAARYLGYEFDVWVMLAGYLFLFILEAATVFSNEYFDFASDVHNKNYGPFNGGSRVVADKLISFSTLRKAINLCVFLLIPSFLFLNLISPAATASNIIICAVITILALGYTVPPLKFSWRGLGELDVALTHSVVVMLCGYIFQGGSVLNPTTWFVSVPLFFSILPAIILSGIPDYDADKAAGKKTIPVLAGKDNAAILAAVFVAAAALTAILLRSSGLVDNIFGPAIYFTALHAFVLCYLLWKLLKPKNKPDRIDGILTVSLLYILWFGIVPLVSLL